MMHKAKGTCCCGATLEVESPVATVVANRVKEFHKAHDACRPREFPRKDQNND